jgi:peptidoglycan hydrolase CwlO-like protein
VQETTPQRRRSLLFPPEGRPEPFFHGRLTMRMQLVIRLAAPAAVAVAFAAGTVQSGGATPPALAAKRAQAARVLNEMAVIDEQLNTTSEQFDGARVRLEALRKNLRAERSSLGHAETRYHQAQRRAMKLLVWLYTSSHSSSLDVILGADNLGEMLKLSDAENAISRQAATIAVQTK